MPLTYALVIGISIGIVHAPDTINQKHRQRRHQPTWQHRHRDPSRGGDQTHAPEGEASQGSDPLKSILSEVKILFTNLFQMLKCKIKTFHNNVTLSEGFSKKFFTPFLSRRSVSVIVGALNRNYYYYYYCLKAEM